MQMLYCPNLTKEVLIYLIMIKRIEGVPMPYRVREATKKEATKCLYEFECLNNDKWNTCSIDEAVPGGLFVKDLCKQKFCNYSLYFGVHNICICPVRREIYELYKR